MTDANAHVWQELIAVYAHIQRALETKDVAAFMELLTPDSILKNVDGTITTRAQFETYLEKLFATMETLLQFDITFETLEMNGDTARVTYTEHNKDLRIDETGQPHTREAIGRERATWIRTDAGWRTPLAERLEKSKTFIDGILQS